jgi:hypothetical protein
VGILPGAELLGLDPRRKSGTGMQAIRQSGDSMPMVGQNLTDFSEIGGIIDSIAGY